MSEVTTEPSTNLAKRKWRFWLWASLLTLVVVLLGAIGVWKSSNYVVTEKLDYIVCTGTIDDEPLVAELNFGNISGIDALIVFPGGRHWTFDGHRESPNSAASPLCCVH